jgi:transcriptional antiterminator RfaH
MRAKFSIRRASDWFVVATKPHKEVVAAYNLEKQGCVVFLPRMRRTVRHARQTSVRAIPLFPGYLFVEAASVFRWRSVNGTFGAIRIITSGDAPAIVERGFVEALKARAGPGDIMDFSGGLQPGDRVELVGGPFARQIGDLANLDDRGRVTVLLEFLAARVPVRTTVGNLLPA